MKAKAKYTIDEVVGGYSEEAAKKGPILSVTLVTGQILQFPTDCTYHFRNVNHTDMLVVKNPQGKICAHIVQAAVVSVLCPQYLIRDRDAK